MEMGQFGKATMEVVFELHLGKWLRELNYWLQQLVVHRREGKVRMVGCKAGESMEVEVNTRMETLLGMGIVRRW